MKRKSVATNRKRPTPSEPQSRAASADVPKTTTAAPVHVEQWQEHEHQATSVQLQAKKLIEETGSPDLAKHAVEMAAPAVARTENVDAQARKFGFESYTALFDASRPLACRDGGTWRIADLGSGRWIAWNNETWPEHKVFDSYEHAERAIQGSSCGISEH